MPYDYSCFGIVMRNVISEYLWPIPLRWRFDRLPVGKGKIGCCEWYNMPAPPPPLFWLSDNPSRTCTTWCHLLLFFSNYDSRHTNYSNASTPTSSFKKKKRKNQKNRKSLFLLRLWFVQQKTKRATTIWKYSASVTNPRVDGIEVSAITIEIKRRTSPLVILVVYLIHEWVWLLLALVQSY